MDDHPDQGDPQPREPIRIKSPALKTIEKNFLQNADDLRSLFTMPRLLVTFIGIAGQVHSIATQHVFHAGVAGMNINDAIDGFVEEAELFASDLKGLGNL